MPKAWYTSFLLYFLGPKSLMVQKLLNTHKWVTLIVDGMFLFLYVWTHTTEVEEGDRGTSGHILRWNNIVTKHHYTIPDEQMVKCLKWAVILMAGNVFCANMVTPDCRCPSICMICNLERSRKTKRQRLKVPPWTCNYSLWNFHHLALTYSDHQM